VPPWDLWDHREKLMVGPYLGQNEPDWLHPLRGRIIWPSSWQGPDENLWWWWWSEAYMLNLKPCDSACKGNDPWCSNLNWLISDMEGYIDPGVWSGPPPSMVLINDHRINLWLCSLLSSLLCMCYKGYTPYKNLKKKKKKGSINIFQCLKINF
jgi:hypothetical protein